MLIGEDEADGVTVLLQGLVGAANPGLKFPQGREVLGVDGCSLGENFEHFIEVAAMEFGS